MRESNLLTVLKVTKLSAPGRYLDGHGLYLDIAPGGSKRWMLRYMRHGRAREMSLGPVHTVTLSNARERAQRARLMLVDGIDPIDQRRRARETEKTERAGRVTFKDAAERYIKAHTAGWRSAKHADQWASTLKNYAYEMIGDLPVADVTTNHVTKILEPIWDQKNETARRVRGRIEAVLDWAKARGLRSGENPARWRGHLDKLLSKRSKAETVRHHPSLAYGELPAFMTELRASTSLSARLLEFIILTAARTSEATGARWVEFDLESKTWTVPGSRMKSKRDHCVPLSGRAVEILKALPRIEGVPFVFPGAKTGASVSNMASLELLRGMREDLTVHGFRATFRTWAAEQTNFPREIAEAALAHVISDKTEAAYQRGALLEKRRKLMDAWAGYCARAASDGMVVPIKAAS